VFAAGDCSRYRLPGSNALTAQTAVRKGKLAARNILRHSGRIRLLEPYWHQDLGYVISLGPSDAVGWIALERNIVAGLPAAVVKEIVEAQYDLLLAGIDTYIL
jgi:NADH dehydrogenase